MIRCTMLAAGLSLLASSLVAQTFPSRHVTMIVPFAAGGATDVIARILAQDMSANLGQTVIVENAAGASGTVSSIKAMQTAPDGYTLLVGHFGTHQSGLSGDAE